MLNFREITGEWLFKSVGFQKNGMIRKNKSCLVAGLVTPDYLVKIHFATAYLI